MTKRGMGMGVAALAGLLVSASGVQAQWARGAEGCEDRWGRGDYERVCVAFDAEFSDPGRLVVDGGMNGGVDIQGWDRNEVSVRARVWATGESERDAQETLDAIDLEWDDGELSADGPRMRDRGSWGVTWEVRVPRSTDLSLETHNGGISIADVDGDIEFEALNGGVHLEQVSGDVEGRTTNGGLDIALDGSRWDGSGLDVETTNGGVVLRVPEGYSADLETGTVNGGIEVDFPVRVQGRVGRRLTTTLGDGGPRVRAMTTNGGVQILRAGRGVR